jgi:allantoin racemase
MTAIRIVKSVPTKSGNEHWRQSTNREHIELVAPKPVETTLWGLPETDVEEIVTYYDSNRVAPLHAQLAVRAEREGFDGIAMGCLLEPGVVAAKEAVRIPVVGAGEAALFVALLVGERIGIVSSSVPGAVSTMRMVRSHGLENKVVAVLPINSRPLDFAHRRSGIPEAMLAQAKRAVEQYGADVIIGYGGLNVIQRLREELPVPVVSPVQAQIVLVEALVRMGLTTSKAAFRRGATP